MSIPLDRLYHYIHAIAEQVRGNYVLIYRFWPHGSKNIEDLTVLFEYGGDYAMPMARTYPQIVCHDQEPLDYDFYQSSIVDGDSEWIKEYLDGIDMSFGQPQNLRVDTKNIYDKCILLHSEQQSTNVQKYQDSHFIPVYYWAHAIIALDWFRFAKHIDIKPNKLQKQFLIYNRAWAGTREYRLKFVELLQQHNLVDDCQTSFNPIDPEHNVHYTAHEFKNTAFKPDHIQDTLTTTAAPSCSSADFTVEDYANTKFEVVLETLFDDSRIQLTEKILRPIACGHPFILASTPGSLAYLRDYGFRTFGGIVDESYDSEPDPVARLNLIVAAMKTITEWTPEQQLFNQVKIKEITNYNKQHFFSEQFFNSIIDELKCNLTMAFATLEDTNTSKTFIEYRKKCNNILLATVDPAKYKINQDRRKLSKHQLMLVLFKARSYYNQYLKSLKE
jgi:hypothetical protein